MLISTLTNGDILITDYLQLYKKNKYGKKINFIDV